MKDDLLASLSPRRRQCLRLLNDGLRAKEIARELGIEEGTVRDHLKAARETVGVSDSLAVARMLVEYERRHPQKLGMLPQAVASMPETPLPDGGSGRFPRSGQAAPTAAVQANDPLGGGAVPHTGSRRLSHLLFPPLDRSPNDLSVRDRIRVIGVEAVIIVAASAGLMGLIIMLNWFLTNLDRHGG